ncbi:uncharacterized protein QC763_507650 [Podospora pseudopauciseta]|uniref:Heterokaryon incompatibility domain-containing protein n=1 Tax=Podospora pseudopauciseta TaxID=2093780 RepID=A0ABR0H9P8_9PEZI|nr:hypothetical protein QC763_507650 [Podospora pseudopauciseta]
MTEFTYKHAPLEQGHIRLLRIEWPCSEKLQPDHPAPDGSIAATLTHHDLSGPPPPYTALSYTWGDEKERLHPPQTLNIASPDSTPETFPIHQSNLYAFLRQARPDLVPSHNGATSRRAANVGYIWIDAICINQADEETAKKEKTAQLKIMSQIYASASRIIIWLGPVKEHKLTLDAPFPENLWPAYPTGHAMDIYQRVAVAWANSQLPDISPTSLLKIVNQVDCACLEAVTRLSYWKRSWIYQEASTPNVPREFWLGGHALWFEALEVANRVFHSHMLELGLNKIPSPSPLNVDIAYLQELTLLRQRGKGGLSLLDLMVKTNSLGARWPVDKVYAMMNIVRDIYGEKDGDIFNSVRVDYELPTEDVYMDVATLIIETTKELDVLLFCSAGQYKGLKSWVPNFYRFVYSVPYRTREVYDAGGGKSSGKKPRFSLNKVAQTLSVWGVKVDMVVGIYPSMRRPLQWGDYTSKTEFWQPIFGPWIRSLARFVFPQPEGDVVEEAYVGGGTLSEAVDSAFSWGMAPGYGTLKRDVDVPHWPLLEQAQASASEREPEEISVERQGFQDFLMQTSAMAFFRTSRGYLGVGDEKMVAGDVVVVVPGLAVPLVLRAIPSYEAGGLADGARWRLVGPCYAKGIMDGEWLGKREEQEFILI